MRLTVVVFGPALAGLLLLGGCATYVNIPAQPGLWASSNPNDPTVQKIVIAALSEVLAPRQSGEPYRVRLADGSSDATYNYVIARLPKGARPAPFVADGELYSVAGVYVRARAGQVDIARPAAAEGRELVSVYLRYYLDGWHPYRVRPWRIPLGRAIEQAAPGRDIQPESQ
ncbi:MAG: hypothetical protein GVY24_00310 [Planctomycetes bacterium]|jgi:hypothetical protein|nr:hypothetical protein [Planctomycetota bacterium]